MQKFPVSPVSAFASALTNRYLVQQLAWRDIVGRYRGSFVGLLWSFINPLLMLLMYTFVFGVVLHAKWGLKSETTFDFSLVLFSGLILHQLLAECINRGPSLITGNPQYVKQVIFPLEILSVVALGSAMFQAAVSMVVLLAFWWMLHGVLSAALFAIPIILIPLCLFALGTSWFLSSISVYFRDMAQVVAFISMGLLFLAPIFYPLESVPEPMRALLVLNPLTYVVGALRGILVRGDFPELGPLLAYYGVSIVVFWLGYAWFQKTRVGFADVL